MKIIGRPLISSTPPPAKTVGAAEMVKGFSQALATRNVESVVVACTWAPGNVGKVDAAFSPKLTLQQAREAAQALRDAADRLDAPAGRTGGA